MYRKLLHARDIAYFTIVPKTQTWTRQTKLGDLRYEDI
jgi:hypothetical protein